MKHIVVSLLFASLGLAACGSENSSSLPKTVPMVREQAGSSSNPAAVGSLEVSYSNGLNSHSESKTLMGSASNSSALSAYSVRGVPNAVRISIVIPTQVAPPSRFSIEPTFQDSRYPGLVVGIPIYNAKKELKNGTLKLSFSLATFASFFSADVDSADMSVDVYQYGTNRLVHTAHFHLDREKVEAAND